MKEVCSETPLTVARILPSAFSNPFVVVVVLLFYVHGKHLWLCWDGQFT